MLSWSEIRDRSTKFARSWKDETRETGEYQTFWNEFFEIFGVQRRSVALYQQQVKKLSGASGFIDLFQPGKLIAEHKSAGKDLDSAFAQAIEYAAALSEDLRPRYIIVTDYAHMRLCDLEGENETIEKYEFPLSDLPKYIRHFAFIPGYEVRKYREQDPVNRKAVRKVVGLHQALATSNYSKEHLGLLLVRIVFCLFADDAGIFPPGDPFKYYLAIGSNEDGTDFGQRLNDVFSTLNTPEDRRQTTINPFLAELPYVNGGLFADPIPTVFFDSSMRHAILDACEFNWSSVSPAIFGSMFQFVMDENDSDTRHDFGAHYTSEKNILKVVDGLFMDQLREELAQAGKNTSKLNNLWNKIGEISLLDPACGCGNFLVIAYRELRRLELDILKQLNPSATNQVESGQSSLPIDFKHLSKLSVEKMYGIELLPFPAEIAKLSLWLSDHLANKELGDYFGAPFIKLPLTEQPHIVKGNALLLDWESVVPKNKLSYILGNPPFIGSKVMNAEQRSEISSLFSNKHAGILDYVCGWYIKAALYIQNTNIEVGFVSTNSITQGEQVAALWGELMSKFHLFITFAHRTFKWSNEAPGKAAVYCVIIGFSNTPIENPILFDYSDVKGEPHQITVKHINPYLVDAQDIFVESRNKPLCKVPEMKIGNKPIDGGFYLFTPVEMEEFIKLEPASKDLFHKWLGADEFLNGWERYVLWLGETSPEVLRSMPEVMKRIEVVKQYRLSSKSAPTRKLAETPTHFHVENIPISTYLLIPRVSSENRRYIPIGFLDANTFTSDSCHTIPRANLYHFGILESEMHMTWMRAVAGRLESRYRYSKDIVYNNFPWPTNSSKQVFEEVSMVGQKILDIRVSHSSATLADLYDPNTMPKELLDAHHDLDRKVESAYGIKKQFDTEALRLEFLFDEYQKLLKSEKESYQVK